MFTVGSLLHNYFVTYGIGVRGSLGIFAFVILNDKLLLTFLDILSVRFKADILNRIAIEYQLCWRGVACVVV